MKKSFWLAVVITLGCVWPGWGWSTAWPGSGCGDWKGGTKAFRLIMINSCPAWAAKTCIM